MKISILLFPSVMVIGLFACHNKTGSTDEVAALYSNTQVISNIEYSQVDSISLALDVYVPSKRLGEPPWVEYSKERKPTLLFFHGGGWKTGDKISRSLFLMPYVSKGWCVVTANYRLLDKASLPEIIGDARAALHWVYDNAGRYKFDTTKIVVSGESAGGHLALMTGLLTSDSLFEQRSRNIHRTMKVAGIINWFGVSDLSKASKGWDSASYKQVVKDAANADSLFRLTSPINYITSLSAPVITIHGDEDHAAPYSQAPLLHEKLSHYGVKNYLYTVKGKKHGNFDPEDMTAIYKEVWKFLNEIGIESK